MYASEVDPSQPALVRSTEPGGFFRGPLANALRVLAVIGGLPSLILLLLTSKLADQFIGPAFFLAVCCGVAAVLAGQVLFARAQRVADSGSVRFPVVPAMRECVRGLAEASFVWAMTLGTAGVLAFLWAQSDLNGEVMARAVMGLVGLCSLGWVGLLGAHLLTELASALVEIANNTQGVGSSDVN